jgi:hypothetical protein
MPRLIITVDVPSFNVEDTLVNTPEEIAYYFLDFVCDDPTFDFVKASWED